jgi:DNA-nicking Smr family endonuclease
MDDPLPLPIDGVLDLHTFRPQDVKEVVLEYLAACREKGIVEVRVIHGKGIGQLRQTVHAILGRHPDVQSFSLAGEAWGGAGATIVHLRPASRD